MANLSQKKQDDDRVGPNTMAAAVTGAVIGAGIAIAGAAALKEENRQKMKEVLISTKERAEGFIEDLKKQAQEKKEMLQEKLAEGKEDLEKAANATKDSLVASRKAKD